MILHFSVAFCEALNVKAIPGKCEVGSYFQRSSNPFQGTAVGSQPLAQTPTTHAVLFIPFYDAVK